MCNPSEEAWGVSEGNQSPCSHREKLGTTAYYSRFRKLKGGRTGPEGKGSLPVDEGQTSLPQHDGIDPVDFWQSRSSNSRQDAGDGGIELEVDGYHLNPDLIVGIAEALEDVQVVREAHIREVQV